MNNAIKRLFQKIFHKIDGLNYIQEYLCLSLNDTEHLLYIYIINSKKEIVSDVTYKHLFIGYCPLIFSLTIENSIADKNILLCFTTVKYLPGKVLDDNNTLASILLQKIHHFLIGNTTIYYYEGLRGKHKFTNNFHQLVFNIYNPLFQKNKKNVYLTNRIYKTVQIAYSIPRVISLITIGNNNTYNLFPTDLHGAINGYYIISLRKNGKACQQVEENKKIAISNVQATYYKQVYSYGKNHMQELRARDNFDFIDHYSELYSLPLPSGTNEYKELDLISSFVHGIHKLFFFRIANTKIVDSDKHTLSHIHKCYATWRDKNNVLTKYLLR